MPRTIAPALAVLALAAAPAAPAAAQTAAQTTDAEDIFILRTKRVESAPGPAPDCERAPFPVRQRDVYQLYSMGGDAGTGLVTDPMAAPAHVFVACLGAFGEDGAFDMYSIGDMNGGYAGANRCVIEAANDPTPGSLLIHCSGRMETAPEGYVGGYMTSSTLAPAGGAEDVPGYTTTSIVTMRLWRAPR